MEAKRMEFTIREGFIWAIRSLNENGVQGVVLGIRFFKKERIFYIDIPKKEISKLANISWWQKNLAA